jgi:hypothetical protein
MCAANISDTFPDSSAYMPRAWLFGSTDCCLLVSVVLSGSFLFLVAIHQVKYRAKYFQVCLEKAGKEINFQSLFNSETLKQFLKMHFSSHR